MKSLYKYIAVLVIVFALLLANELSKPQPPNWRKTYAQKDKIPFGGYVVYHQLKKLNSKYPFEVAKENPYEYIDDAEDIAKGTPANLIIIQSTGEIDLYEWDKIKDFVKRGNTVFIASNSLSDDVLSDVHLEQHWMQDELLDDTVFKGKLIENTIDGKAKYTSNFVDNIAYFEIADSQKNEIKTLGVVNGFFPDFVQCTLGSGTLFLHANPLVFSNIHVLNKNNYIYTFAALSYLPQQATIWDEFYKDLPIEKSQTKTPLAFFLSQPALKWMLYTLLLGVVLFFIFRAKRRQRIIPIITPLTNTSLEFTETIGRLYFNKGNHYDIAQKKIQYFIQYVYSRYNLRFDEKAPEFVFSLSEKSGVSEVLLLDILKRISTVRRKKGVGPNELLELNQKIDTFYKTAK